MIYRSNVLLKCAVTHLYEHNLTISVCSILERLPFRLHLCFSPFYISIEIKLTIFVFMTFSFKNIISHSFPCHLFAIFMFMQNDNPGLVVTVKGANLLTFGLFINTSAIMQAIIINMRYVTLYSELAR